jgi:hypothetical protein
MAKKIPTVKFLGYRCEVLFGEYSNGRTAIELVIKKTGEPMAVASVNLPYHHLESNEVAIKNYSENQGVLDVLIAANIISQPVRFIQTGFIEAPICKLINA